MYGGFTMRRVNRASGMYPTGIPVMETPFSPERLLGPDFVTLRRLLGRSLAFCSSIFAKTLATDWGIPSGFEKDISTYSENMIEWGLELLPAISTSSATTLILISAKFFTVVATTGKGEPKRQDARDLRISYLID